MPTLAELASPDAKRENARTIAWAASQAKEAVIGLNDGLRTTQELLDRIKAGYDVQFDYRRLAKESQKYA